MSDGIIAVEEEGRIFVANPRLEALSGYARRELLGMLIEVLVPTDRRHTHRLQRSGYHQTGAPPRPMGTGLDIRFRRKDGSEFPVDVALSPVETATGRVVIAAVRDVSDRKVGGTARSRERLERELHGGAQQALFGVSLNLQTAPALAADSGLRQRLESAINRSKR